MNHVQVWVQEDTERQPVRIYSKVEQIKAITTQTSTETISCTHFVAETCTQPRFVCDWKRAQVYALTKKSSCMYLLLKHEATSISAIGGEPKSMLGLNPHFKPKQLERME